MYTRISSSKNKAGFRNLAEFCLVVKNSSVSNTQPDPRLLLNAPSTFSSEGVGVDGGFAVPPAFADEIAAPLLSEESVLGMTDIEMTPSNTWTTPKDNTPPWDTTNGVQVYWDGEGAQFNQSNLQLEAGEARLNKLTAMVPIISELWEDAPALGSYLRKTVSTKMDFKITDAIINGTGVGMPLGILNSPALITVDKEGSQPADTVVFNNLINMHSSLYGPCRKTAVWMINQDIEKQLMTMSFEGASSSVPAYTPANAAAGSPYPTFLTHPVIPTQACQTLGDKGDIVLADLSQYLCVLKTAKKIRETISIHIWFDYDIMAFKFTFRIAGFPWWHAPITAKNSSTQVSSIVTLAERA